jgi:hypothetical protein
MMPDSVCEGVSDTQSEIPINVITAYRLAYYTFQTDAESIDFAIDRFCPGIAELFKKLRQQTAVCITAYNLLGQELSEPENEAASEELRNALMEQGWSVFSAVGRGPEGNWGPEPGYMFFGVTCKQAKQLGGRFHQNAVVWIGPNAVPKLVLLR